MKKIIILFTTTALAGMIVATIIYLDLKRYATQPVAANAAPPKTMVTVAPGTGFSQIARQLAQKSLIVSPLRFGLIARIQGLDKGVKAGEYALAPSMTPMQIIDVLTKGRVYLHRLTIPEGFNAAQIAAAVEQAGFGEAKAFLQKTRDPKLLKRLNIEADSFEGYLFPDTYMFAKGTPIAQIITTMVDHFNQRFTDKWKARARELGFSVHEVITLASIIEKETGNASERKLISSVFHNRLKKNMRLETDPTVIYGIENFDGNLTRKHLTTWTPYNTYKIKGLPPGPIASPGAAAIEAALYPEDSDYLFFVSKKDTTHYFSKDINEHNRAVRKYQLRSNRKKK